MISEIEKKKYLDLTIKIIKKELLVLKLLNNKKFQTKFDKKIKKELKSPTDKIIEKNIISKLSKTKINILTEEQGLIKNKTKTNVNLKWIVDPIDGTVNFTRNIGNCGISIALFEKDVPVFGVIGVFPSGQIYYGGKTLGSFYKKEKICVSKTSKKNRAIICTGFPSRFDFKGKNYSKFINKLSNYAKVRMLGSASISLIHIAKGSADVYFEEDIMIWDIAAGIAILQGANGYTKLKKGKFDNSYILFASNGNIARI